MKWLLLVAGILSLLAGLYTLANPALSLASMALVFALVFGDTDHVYQNKQTVLDPYAYVMARWSVKTPKAWTDYPNLARFMRHMDQDPAVQKVKELSK